MRIGGKEGGNGVSWDWRGDFVHVQVLSIDSFIDPKQCYCSKSSVANEIMSLQSRSYEISESSSLSEFGSALFCFLRAKGGQVKSTGYFLGYDTAVA